MAAYWIAQHTITEPAKFEEYRVKVGPMIATARRPPDRVVIIEFPDIGALNAWYNSAEYQPLIILRQSAVDMDKETLITLQGA
jgi:uncharacterized protein (DUF1330 family)